MSTAHKYLKSTFERRFKNYDKTINDIDVRGYLSCKARWKKILREHDTTITIGFRCNSWFTDGWFDMDKNTIPMEVNWCFYPDNIFRIKTSFFSDDYKYYYYPTSVFDNEILVRFPTYLLFKNIVLDNVNFDKYKKMPFISDCLCFMYNDMMKYKFKGKSKIRQRDFLDGGIAYDKKKILNAMTIYFNFKAQNYGK